MANGKLECRSDLEVAKGQAIRIRRLCLERSWKGEGTLIAETLKALNRIQNSRRSLGGAVPGNNSRENVIDLEERRNDILQRKEGALREIDNELKMAIDMIDTEYWQEAESVDAYYQNPEVLRQFSRPSRDLLEAQEMVKKLLKQNRLEEAAACKTQIRRLKKADEQRLSALVQEKYYAADRKLKEEFAVRRKILLDRFADKKVREIRSFEKEIEVVDRKISNLRANMEREKWKRGTDSACSSPRRKTLGGKIAVDSESLLARLELKAPPLLKRDNDIEILQGMTDGVRGK
jgi:hypothetical protein